jgi:hypothetical protein
MIVTLILKIHCSRFDIPIKVDIAGCSDAQIYPNGFKRLIFL